MVLQHEATAPPDHFASWLDDRGIPYEVCRVWEQGPPPGHGAYPWICALGSDSTPGQPDPPPWMDAELALLGAALEDDVPILGLCFGGQALAAAAGAAIHPADPPEVGWAAIESADEDLVPAGPWLHFHYDQLELPRGAIELARSAAGTAAFRLGRSLGLQFHPEVTPGLAASWAQAESDRLGGPRHRPRGRRRDGGAAWPRRGTRGANALRRLVAAVRRAQAVRMIFVVTPRKCSPSALGTSSIGLAERSRHIASA